MEGTSHAIQHKTFSRGSSKFNKQNILNKLTEIAAGSTFLLAVVGFLVGRVSILNDLSPFGVALLVSVSLTLELKDTTIIGIGIIAGMVTRNNGYNTVQSIISIMLLFVLIKALKFSNRTSALKAAATAFLVNLGVSIIFNLVSNGQFILYDTLMGIFNSVIVFALVYIFNYSVPIIIERKKRLLLSNEEIICASIVCSIIISGFADVFIFGISIKVLLSIFIIAASAFKQGAGAGAAIGATIGLITCISSNQAPIIMGTYAFCGLLSGVFKDMGKFMSAVGFVIGDAVVVFYLGGENNVISLKELIAGLILFIAIPSPIMQKFLPFIETVSRINKEQVGYAERVKDMVRARLLRVTNVFRELSKTLEDSESSEKLRQNSEINRLINSVVDKVCAECDIRNTCWKRDFYCTYQNMFEMMDVIESDGSVEIETLPQDLKKKCVKVNLLMKTANYMFDIYRMNFKWRRKAQEGKRVICEQLEGISEILTSLSDDIKREVKFNRDIEEEIAVALDKEGINVNDVAVIKDKFGKFEVNIYKRSCLGRRKCIKDVSPVVSRVLKKKMQRDKAPCMTKEGTNQCCFRLVEAVKYQVSTGVAKEAKDDSGVSGDNYSFLELNDGKYMMVLSDGMGTGPAAAIESNSAVSMLEKYLEAGFDKSTTLKAINSAMALKSPDDNFATIDLCITDLYTGDVELVKIGSASTYIKRMDGGVEAFASTTLPIGILNNVDIETSKFKMEHGDMIVMVSDGVQDTAKKDEGDWIARALEGISSRNPQQVADEILDKAKKRSNGKVNDDMTVLVSKIWEMV